MIYRVLQRLITKTKVYLRGDTYENPQPGRFTRRLLEYGFIEPVPNEEPVTDVSWDENAIKSDLAKVLIAPVDYTDGDKKYFTWDEACALEKKLGAGWRLPTRKEWGLICEEFGTKDDRYDIETLEKNLGLKRKGLLYDECMVVDYAGDYGYYWSSTPYSSASVAYSLAFYGTSFINPSYNSARRYGLSVRLVKDLKERA